MAPFAPWSPISATLDLTDVAAPPLSGSLFESSCPSADVQKLHKNEHHGASPGLLTIPAELRLEIYGHVLPLHIESGDISGLVLSCRTIKEEVYHEMRKEINRFNELILKRWPFEEKCRVVFQGLLFTTKHVIVDAPHLLDVDLDLDPRHLVGILYFPMSAI